MEKNLFICMTPLQCIFARSIIESRSDQRYDLIYVTNYSYEKSLFYFEKIKILFDRSEFFYFEKSRLGFLKFYASFKSENKYNNIYVASINNIYCQFILSISKFDRLITYDDGFANIYKEGEFFLSQKKSYKKFIKKILGITYDVALIRELSDRHYTFYEGFDNISKKLLHLRLWKGVEFLKKENQPSLKVFVGQPLKNVLKSDVDKILDFFEIDVYFPHPGEGRELGGGRRINTNLICEDYILEMIKGGEFGSIKVYGFCSTVLLNLSSISGVELFSLRLKKISDSYHNLYETFLHIKQIEIVEIEGL